MPSPQIPNTQVIPWVSSQNPTNSPFFTSLLFAKWGWWVIQIQLKDLVPAPVPWDCAPFIVTLQREAVQNLGSEYLCFHPQNYCRAVVLPSARLLSSCVVLEPFSSVGDLASAPIFIWKNQGLIPAWGLQSTGHFGMDRRKISPIRASHIVRANVWW